jgi:hypothetical protein
MPACLLVLRIICTLSGWLQGAAFPDPHHRSARSSVCAHHLQPFGAWQAQVCHCLSRFLLRNRVLPPLLNGRLAAVLPLCCSCSCPWAAFMLPPRLRSCPMPVCPIQTELLPACLPGCLCATPLQVGSAAGGGDQRGGRRGGWRGRGRRGGCSRPAAAAQPIPLPCTGAVHRARTALHPASPGQPGAALPCRIRS